MAFKFNVFTSNFDEVSDVTATIIYDVQSVSGVTGVTSGNTYLVDTSGGVATMNLPAPALDAFIRIKDSGFNANTNNITVVRNAAEEIEGVAASFVMDSDGQEIQRCYLY